MHIHPRIRVSICFSNTHVASCLPAFVHSFLPSSRLQGRTRRRLFTQALGFFHEHHSFLRLVAKHPTWCARLLREFDSSRFLIRNGREFATCDSQRHDNLGRKESDDPVRYEHASGRGLDKYGKARTLRLDLETRLSRCSKSFTMVRMGSFRSQG